MKRFILLALALMLIGATTACNTIRGFGTDLEDAGQYVKNSTNK